MNIRRPSKKQSDPHSQARDEVLNIAEEHFSKRGYSAVTLRDIANTLSMSQAALYYHAPGGKEELYIKVMERMLKRYQAGLTAAITGAGESLWEQMHAAAHYLLAQPPMDLGRMTNSDFPALHPDNALRLEQRAFAAVLLPIDGLFAQAAARGEITPHLNTLDPLAGMFLSVVQGLHAVPDKYLERTRAAMLDDMLGVMYRGLRQP